MFDIPIVSTATLQYVGLGVINFIIIQVVKKFGFNQKYVILAMAILNGLLLRAFQNFLPADMQKSILDTAMTIISYAIFIYNLITMQKEPLKTSTPQ